MQPNQTQQTQQRNPFQLQAAQSKPSVITASSLCKYASFDLPEELEIDMWQNHRDYMQIVLQKPSSSERISHLQRLVSQSHDQHNKVVSGLLFGILTCQSSQVESLFQELASIVRDYFKFAIFKLTELTMLCYRKFQPQSLERIIYMTEQLLVKAVPNIKELILILIQQISVNKADEPSVYLNRTLLPLLIKHVQWVTQQSDQFPSLVFIKFLRQAEEHNDQPRLREQELALCIQIWQVRSSDCQAIGREFGRIITNLAREPQLNQLIQDVKANLRIIFKERGAQRNFFISSLVPLDVQRKLDFMLSQIPENIMFMYTKWMLDSAGVQFGTESESLLVDIVRHIVVNITPTNEVIQSAFLQRYTLIGHFINQAKDSQFLIWILQSLFIDWLYYDEKAGDSIMLVEPGMLLIQRSADSRPWMTDMLVEYLDNYARQFDPSKQDDAFLSIQRVFVDCERKGVIKSCRDLINNSSLKPQTQMKLKTFYRYGALLDERHRTQIRASADQEDPNKQQEQMFQQAADSADAFASEDQEMVGSFSPPHVPLIPESQVMDAAKSPMYESDQFDNGAYQIDKVFGANEYNIDLFNQPSTELPAPDAVMQEFASQSKEDNEESSSSDSSSDSSDSSKMFKIEVPQTTLNRFFSRPEVYTDFLKQASKESFHQLMNNVGQTYKVNENSVDEVTELAYILFERLKCSQDTCGKSLITENVDNLISSAKGVLTSSVLLADYLHGSTFDKQLITQLILSMQKFDAQFQAKVLYFILQKPNSSQVIASLRSAQTDLVHQALHVAISSFNFKFLNVLLLAIVDSGLCDQVVLNALLTFSTPETMQKVLFGVHMGRVKITLAKITTKLGVCQTMWLWKIMIALQKKGQVSLAEANNFVVNLIRDSITTSKSNNQTSVQADMATHLVGYLEFCSILISSLTNQESFFFEIFIAEIATYLDIQKLLKQVKTTNASALEVEIQNQAKHVLREFTKVIIQMIFSVSLHLQDFTLGTLLEHSKTSNSSEVAHLYRRFDSVDQCLKAAQQILKSQLALQYMEAINASETTKTNFSQFSSF